MLIPSFGLNHDVLERGRLERECHSKSDEIVKQFYTIINYLIHAEECMKIVISSTFLLVINSTPTPTPKNF